jgi:formylmethanofuran dehydrogenase subunit E
MASKKVLTGLRCDKCLKPVNQNHKRTKKGHAACFPDLPVMIESR